MESEDKLSPYIVRRMWSRIEDMKFSIILLASLMCGAHAEAAGRKPYVPAPWISTQQNKHNAEVFSTQGAIVFIDMKFSSGAEGDRDALHYFADATKRYSQATRFIAEWETDLFNRYFIDRWIYDRNLQVAFGQSSQDGGGLGGFNNVEPVGVTDQMIWQAASEPDPDNSVYDLLRYGAINRRVFWKSRWILISKTDPRIQKRKGLLFSPEPKKH